MKIRMYVYWPNNDIYLKFTYNEYLKSAKCLNTECKHQATESVLYDNIRYSHVKCFFNMDKAVRETSIQVSVLM